MSRFKLLDRLRGSVLAGSVGTSASEDKLLSSRESHPGVIPDYPGLKLGSCRPSPGTKEALVYRTQPTALPGPVRIYYGPGGAQQTAGVILIGRPWPRVVQEILRRMSASALWRASRR